MSTTKTLNRIAWTALLAVCVCFPSNVDAAKKGKKTKQDAGTDPYANIVWPPPPDEARIKLERVLTGRTDVEAKSRLRRILIGSSPKSPYDTLRKPFAVAFDSQARILVTDWGTAALVRFDRQNGRFDVLGTRSTPALKQPLGLALGGDDSIYVADVGLQQVLHMDSDGKILEVFGRSGELTNPTDAALSPDGSRLYVTDSKKHRVVVFDAATGEQVDSFGEQGSGEGKFHFPTAISFDADGNLLVVDQMNARVQLLASDGEYLDEFGGRGVGFGNFSRPKDVAVDGAGLIYVTDNAFNNVQLFDSDFSLLTFVGETGSNPGRFWGASGVAVRGDEFAIVDQIGARVQVFRYLQTRDVPVTAPPTARVAALPSGTPPVPSPPRRREAPTPPQNLPAQEPLAEERPTVEPVVEPVVEPLEVGTKAEGSSRPAPSAEPAEVPEVSAPSLPAPVEPLPEPPAPAAEAQEPLPVPVPEPAIDAPPDPVRDITDFVENWRSAWAGQRVGEYLQHYASAFRPDGMSREAWERQRRERLTAPWFIEVGIDELDIAVLGATEATAKFVQTYRSDRFRDQVRKTLRLVFEGGEWRILEEAADATPGS